MPSPSYVGSGAYCYTNCLAMALSAAEPGIGFDTRLIETCTGSPFGFCLEDGMPMFSPADWNPDIGVDQALRLLGWEASRRHFTDLGSATDELRTALISGPVVIGPVDMGGLRHHPDSDSQSEVDHFVLAIDVTHTDMVFHDPRGYPWSRLPIGIFGEAWRAEGVSYCVDSYVMRSDFHRTSDVSEAESLNALLPLAADLAGRESANEYRAFADVIRDGLTPEQRGFLVWFSLPVAARRRDDASTVLRTVPAYEPFADLLYKQAQLCGLLQYPAVRGDDVVLADGFGRLADLHEAMTDVLFTLIPRC